MDLLTYRTTVRFTKCLIHLRNLSDPFFYRRPVVRKAINAALTSDLLDTDVSEARGPEQAIQSISIGKRP